MWLFRRKENRASLRESEACNMTDALLRALIGTDTITREMALQIPSVKASVEYVKNVISSLPIKLYERTEIGVKEITNDNRVGLLNNDTKGCMTGTQLKKAIVDNYLLDKGAYIYIEKKENMFKSLRFVENTDVSIYHNDEPIFKDYHILVRGNTYYPYEFIKILRNTTDGFTGHSLIEENSIMLAVAYNSMIFENKLVKKGGNKKGFLTSQRHLDETAITALKEAWNNLYTNNSDNVVILNDGMDFKESSNTSVEMQLNENKLTNSEECTMLFTIANAIVRGKASNQDIKNFVKFCIIPIVADIESSLNRDFLLEKEKKNRYWSFDTVAIDRGSFKDRIEAYSEAIKANIMQVDEAREREDLAPLGFNFVQLGLDTVLYDTKTNTIYTPNTNQTQNMDKLELQKGGE